MSWYISHAGRVLGPLDAQQVQQRLDAGSIRPDDRVARPGDTRWLPAAHVFASHFPLAGRGTRAAVATLLVLCALACWAAYGGLRLVYLQVADPERALSIGLAAIGACLILMLVAGTALLWLRLLGKGRMGTALKATAWVMLVCALPGLGLAVVALGNTIDSDAGVDPHELLVNENGELLLLGGLGRTLVHDLQAVLATLDGDLVLVLDNAGGLIDVAEAAGLMLRERGPFTARVDGECASACTLLLATAGRIELYADSRIGLHRPSSILGGEVGIDADATIEAFTAHLARAGFGPRALAAVREVPADGMLWLEPATHIDALPPFHLLDDDGHEIEASQRDVVLARDLLARKQPLLAQMLELVHAAFPDHAREHSASLLAANASEEGFDEALGELLQAPFDAALAAAPPSRLRAWLATLVKLDEQFEWDAPADACYRHARHPKAREVAMARATELMRDAARADWQAPEVDAHLQAALPTAWSWPVGGSVLHPGAEDDCQALLAAARAVSHVPDARLLASLLQRLARHGPAAQQH